MNGSINCRWVFFSSVVSVLVASQVAQQQTGKTPIVAIGPQQGTVRWADPLSDKELGSGALLNIKIDRFSVPYTNLMVMTQKLAASGIPVHSHRWEDEVIRDPYRVETDFFGACAQTAESLGVDRQRGVEWLASAVCLEP